jgi:hypothetical protein
VKNARGLRRGIGGWAQLLRIIKVIGRKVEYLSLYLCKS